MQLRVVLGFLAATAVAVSPAFATKKNATYELEGTLPARTAAVSLTLGSEGDGIADGDRHDVHVQGTPGLDATGLQALRPTQVFDQTRR
jgi:hypothetical protein